MFIENSVISDLDIMCIKVSSCIISHLDTNGIKEIVSHLRGKKSVRLHQNINYRN